VEENIARRRDGMMPAVNLAERMQVLWPWHSEKPVPRIGAKPHDAGQPAFEITKTNRPQESGQIATQGANGRVMLQAGIDGHDEKYGCARQLCDNRL
jgi:hypothetical protein